MSEDSASLAPPTSPQDTLAANEARAQSLRRMKALALGMLIIAIIGLAFSEWMGGQGGWGWLAAFCEAAAVGALADWFAVVALFRHPLGLPIPHTAIIPSSKHRIADNLAAFVRDHFLDSKSLLTKLAVINPAAKMGEWLSQAGNVRSLVGSVRMLLLEGLNLLDEASVRRGIHGFVIAKARSWDAAATGAEVLDLLTRDGRHQELLDGAMLKLAEYLQDPDNKRQAAELMVRYARKEWPKFTKLVNIVKSVDELADDFADRLARSLIEEMAEALSDPEHAVRLKYEAWLAEFIGRLKADPLLATRINEIKNQIVEHPAVREYVNGIWLEVHAALKRDLQREDSNVARYIEQGLLDLGGKLGRDPALREAINMHVMSAADKLAGTLQSTVTHHIAQTVKGWNEQQLVRQIELSVGRDLQFIRLNGTLVGGVVGLVLHAVLTLVVPLLHG